MPPFIQPLGFEKNKLVADNKANTAIQVNEASADAFAKSATAEPFKVMYNKLVAANLEVPDFDTFRKRYSDDAGMDLLWGKLSNANVEVPKLRDFKNKYSPALTEASFLSKVWNAVAPPATLPNGQRSLLGLEEENLAKAAAAKNLGYAKIKTPAEIELDRAKQIEVDKTPNDLISGIMLAAGPKTAKIDKYGNYTIPPTGNQVADVAAHTAAQQATKRAQDLIIKSGYALDPLTGNYVAGEPVVPLEDLRKDYSQVYLDLEKTFNSERNASIKKSSDRWEVSAMDSPTLLHKVWRLGNAIFANPAEEDDQRLGDMAATLQNIKNLGTQLERKKQRQPDVEIAKLGTIENGTDFSDPKQAKNTAERIDSGTRALKAQLQTIKTDPNWTKSEVVAGIDQKEAVNDYSNKDAKKQLVDNSMRALDRELFYVQSAISRKSFLESTIYNSNKQLEQIDKDINGLINVTKGTRLTDKGEAYLQTLQDLRIKLKDNVTAQEEVLGAVSEGIGTNSKVIAADEAQKDLINKDYDNNNWSLAPAVRFIAGQPRHMVGMLEAIGNDINDREYRSRKYSEEAADYTPQALQDAKADALSFDVGKKAEGKSFLERIHVNKLGLFHTAIEQSIISAELGIIGSATMGTGAALLGGVATRAAGMKIAQLGLAANTGSKAAQFALWTGRGVKGAAGWGLDVTTGFIAPSVLLFGDKMVDAELKNGRSAEHAIRLGVLRAGIEGLTERVNPFEMNLLRGRILSGATKNLGEDVLWKNLTAKNLLSKRAFTAIYGAVKPFALGTAKQMNLEAVEEDIGLFMNDMVSKIVQQGSTTLGVKGDATYRNDEPFNLQNLVNTHILTMATMAVQGGIGGINEARHELKSLKDSRFMVANSPELYKSVIAEKLAKGLITKDQAVEAIDRVGALHDTLIDPIIKPKIDEIMSNPLISKEDKIERSINLFDASYQFQNHAKAVAKLSPEERAEKLITISDAFNEALKEEKWRGESTADPDNKEVAKSSDSLQEERNAIQELDNTFSAEKINNTTVVEGPQVVDKTTGETTQKMGLKQHLEKAKKELARLQARREDDQPLNFMEKLKTIIGNLETRIRTIEGGGTSVVSKSNPQILESSIAAPATTDTTPITPPVTPPVVTPVAPIIAPPPPPTTEVVAPAITVAPVAAVTTEEETEEEEPDTSGEAMPNEAALREMHAEHYEGKRAKSFEAWLNTAAGKKAVKSFNPATVKKKAKAEKESKIKTDVAANNLSDEEVNSINVTGISRLGIISENADGEEMREDNGEVFDAEDRTTYMVDMIAFRSREFREDAAKQEVTNTLNTKFDPILDPKGLLPDPKTGEKAVVVIKLNTSTEFAEEGKRQLSRNKEQLLKNLDNYDGTPASPEDVAILSAEIDQDLADESNFWQLDVHTSEDSPAIGNIHVLSFANEYRVIPTIINPKGEIVQEHNLVRNYRELKAFREKILASMGDTGITKLQVDGKGNGYVFTEKENKQQSAKDAIKNKDVINTIQVSTDVPTRLSSGKLGDSRSTINETVPGGTYIVIPTGRNDLFAWQVNAKKATKEVVDSYMAAIEFFEKYLTASTKEKAEMLNFVEEFMPGFDITNEEGLRTYLNNLIPSSSSTSHYTQNYNSEDTTATFDKKFIDFNARAGEKKITFSNTRTRPASYTASPTPNLTHDLYEEAGIYELDLGGPEERGTKEKPKLKKSEIKALLREHLAQRRLATNKTSFTDHKDTAFSLPIIKVSNGKFSRLKEADAKQDYKNYKEYLKENTTTNLLEHKTSTGASAYFQQPSVRVSLKDEVPPKPVTVETVTKDNLDLGKVQLKKLQYKNHNRRADGRVIGGQSGWKLRFNIKSPTGTNYFNAGNKQLENDPHYMENAKKLEDWLNAYFETTSKGDVASAVKGYKHYGFTAEHPSSIWKFLSGGEQGESDFTIYIGSADDALKFVEDVKKSPIYGLLVAGNQSSDVSFTPDNVMKGRIEGADIGFSGYHVPTNLNKITGKKDFTFTYNGKLVNVDYGEGNSLSQIHIYVQGGTKAYKGVFDEELKKDYPELHKNLRNIIGFQVYGDYLKGSKGELEELTGTKTTTTTTTPDTTTKTTTTKKSTQAEKIHKEIIGTFAIPTEKVVKSKGASNGRTVRRDIQSKVSSDGEIIKITPKNTFTDNNEQLSTSSNKMTLQEFKDFYYPLMTKEEIELFEENAFDVANIVFKEARIGLVGDKKGQVNIDVLLDGVNNWGITLTKRLSNAEVAILEGKKEEREEEETEVPDVETETDEVPESVVFYRKLKAAKTYTEAKALIDSNPAYPGIQASIDAVLKKLESTKTYEEKKAEFDAKNKEHNAFFRKLKDFNGSPKRTRTSKEGIERRNALEKVADGLGYPSQRKADGKLSVKTKKGMSVVKRSYKEKPEPIVDGKLTWANVEVTKEDALAFRPFYAKKYSNGDHKLRFRDMSTAEVNKGFDDLAKGDMESGPAQKVLKQVATWKSAGEVEWTRGSGIGVEVTAEPFDDYVLTSQPVDVPLTEEETEQYSKEYDEWFDSLTPEEQQNEIDRYEDNTEPYEDTEGTDYEEEDVAGEPEDKESTEAGQPEIVEPEIVIAPEVRAWATLNIEEFTEEPVTQAELEEIQAVMFPEGVPEVTPSDTIKKGTKIRKEFDDRLGNIFPPMKSSADELEASNLSVKISAIINELSKDSFSQSDISAKTQELHSLIADVEANLGDQNEKIREPLYEGEIVDSKQDLLDRIKDGLVRAEEFLKDPSIDKGGNKLNFSEVVITPEDRIIFGHPTIGKSFLKKEGRNDFITLDDDYADEVNVFVDANRGDKTRQEYKGSKPAEYNKFMLDLYDRLKAQAAKEGKVLFVSNTNILKERMADFDKVITMPKDEFKKRLDQRGSTYDFENWKSDIDDVVSKVDKSKLITTDKYLSDLLPPVEDHKNDYDKAEAEIAAEKAADTAARELELAKIKQAVKDTKLTKAEKKVIADVAAANGAPDAEIFLQNAVVATNAGAPLNLSGPRKLLNKFNEIVKRILKNLVLLAVIVNLFMGASSVYQPNSVSLKQVSAIEIPADITSENELIKNSYQVAKAKSPDQTVVILDKALAKIFVIDTSGKTLFEGAAVFGKDSGDIHDKNIKFDSFQDTAWLSTNQRITPTGAFTATKVTDSVYGGGNYFDIHGTVRRGKGDVAYAIKDAANKIAEKITGDTTDVFTLGNKPFGVITAFHGMVMKPGRIAAMKTKTSEDNMVTTGCFSILPADMAKISPHMTDKISVVVIPAGAARTSFKMYLESQAKGTVLYSDWVNSMETTKAAEAEKEEKKTPVKAPMTAGIDATALALAAALALKKRKELEGSKPDNIDEDKLVQEAGRALKTFSEPEIKELESTITYELLDAVKDNKLSWKTQKPYMVLPTKASERFLSLMNYGNKFGKESVLPNKFNDDDKEVIYIKSNKRKNSLLYDVVDGRTGEVLRQKVRLYLSGEFEKFDVKGKIADSYGLNFNPTKVFSANRSIAFALYRQMPSKAKYIAQAKKYLYSAIKFVGKEETGTAPYINLNEIEAMLDMFPEGMWSYINTTVAPEATTEITGSTAPRVGMKFPLPKLGWLQELEKIVGQPINGQTFVNYDRSGSLEKRLKVKWGDPVTIDPATMTTRQLRIATSYFISNKTKYFKPSSTDQNIRKYAEHRGIDYKELMKRMTDDDAALDDITHNTTGNSDTMELSKWRESIREYDWQSVELYQKVKDDFDDKVAKRLVEKFEKKLLPNGESYLKFFFGGEAAWLNINFNNISGTYYKTVAGNEVNDTSNETTQAQNSGQVGQVNTDGVGPRNQENPFFTYTTYARPKTGVHYLQDTEVYNRLAAVLHEPFHALHALSYGSKEELAMRAAFDKLASTKFGNDLLKTLFEGGYNRGATVTNDTAYKETVAFMFQLMAYPKEWVKKTELLSNDIYEFIEKVQTLQDKTYTETVKTQSKVGTVETQVTEEEKIKLTFFQELYNLFVSALNKLIPISKKYVNLLETSRLVSKTVTEDLFGTTEEVVTRTKVLSEDVKKAKEEFLGALDELNSTMTALINIDEEALNPENIKKFFKKTFEGRENKSTKKAENSDNLSGKILSLPTEEEVEQRKKQCNG